MKFRKFPLIFILLLSIGFVALFQPANKSYVTAKSLLQEDIPPALTDNVSRVTDQIIIRYTTGSFAYQAPASVELLLSEAKAIGTDLKYFRSMAGDAHVLRLPERLPLEEVQAIIDKLKLLPDVAYAEPDYIRYPTLVPNDSLYSNQWDFYDSTGGINIQPAWDITTGSSSVVVAIGDTGLTTHVDLSGRMVSGAVSSSGYDFINDALVGNDGNTRDSDPSDPGDWVTSAESASGFFAGCTVDDSSWHGTHVAGTIGAASNNSQGVAGINWSSPLLILRVLGKCGGYDSDIIDGITWAAGLPVSGVPANSNPAKVINLSLGGTSASCPSTWQTAINNITAAGAVVVVAAGNNAINASGFTPANCNGVITVAATGLTGSLATYSNYGTAVELSAPGGSSGYGILSTLNTGTTVPVSDSYVYYQGTSMAAPHVTGVVSLMYSINPSLTTTKVLEILQGTARAFPSGSTCTTSLCGSGILDAGAAVSAAQLPGGFTKTNPSSGAISQPTSLTLTWGSSARATTYSYCIDTIDNSSCDTSWVSVAENTTASLSSLSANTTYYWQVLASNGWVETYADTATWQSFTTGQNSFLLEVIKSGVGNGTVTSDPAGIDCGSTCSASFTSSSSVILTATENADSTFAGWSGGGCTGTGTCTVSMDEAKTVTATFTHLWQTWYLAEGYTGAGFNTFILIQNPNVSAANVTITYMLQTGETLTRSIIVAANSRYTIVAQDTDQVGLDQAFSTKLESDQPIIVERAMYWPDTMGTIGGHVTTGFNSPQAIWYLAEGYTGANFGTYILIQNPNASVANVTLTYMLQTGGTLTRSITVTANSRYTVVAQDAEQVGLDQAFSTKIESDQPIIVERAMYFVDEGHAAGGITNPQLTWYLAEGYTGSGFGTYILIQNPNDSAANVTIIYMLQTGGTVTRNVTVAANSRYTVVAQDAEQVGADQAFSTKLVSDLPIIVERAMYSPKGTSSTSGHDSSGTSSPGYTWYLAEGFTGSGYETFILVQNPNDSVANVTITYMLQTGGTVTRSISVSANSRYTVVAQEASQVGTDQAFSTMLSSDQPIIVERAMYFANGGTDTMGVMQP